MNTYTTAGNPRLIDQIPVNTKTALDIGCATGRMAKSLSQFGILTDGVTFNKEEKIEAEKHCRQVWLYDLEQGLPTEMPDKYDIVILSHVLEHIANPSNLLRDIRASISGKSLILCSIPNMLFIYNRLKLLAGKIEYEERGIMDYTHLRWYTKTSLIKTFEDHGFNFVSFTTEGNAPLGPLRKIIPKEMAAKIDRLLLSIAPSWIAWEYSFTFKLSD